jgi:hypothetical protein
MNPPLGMLLSLQTHSWTTLLHGKAARTQLEGRLREAKKRYRLPVLGYVVMPRNVAILVLPDSLTTVGLFVGYLCGGAASGYARRTGREGPFWKRRGQYTLIRGTAALQHCLQMLVSEPVRQEIALHPCDYSWSAYRELIGLRHRYRVLDHPHLNRLYQGGDNLHGRIAESMEAEQPCPWTLADWTRALAVGDKDWIQAAVATLPHRRPSVVSLDPSGRCDIQAAIIANHHRRYYLRRLHAGSLKS